MFYASFQILTRKLAGEDAMSLLFYPALCGGVLMTACLPLFDYHANFPPTRRGGGAIRIPALTPVIRSVVDRPHFSFVSYASKTTDTTSELYQWMGRVFFAFRELEVRLLLGEIAPQLRHSA